MTDMRKDKCLVNTCFTTATESKVFQHLNRTQLSNKKPSLLLHSCCGPCSTSVIEQLIGDYDITVFFYNPNITDKEEYEKRKEAQIKVINVFNKNNKVSNKVKFFEGKYDPENFIKRVEGHENDKEGGNRCNICFTMRLEETALVANMHNFDVFTTTLTVSPHKNYEIISRIGKNMGVKYKVNYLDGNFKKKDGFKRSIELSKSMNIYRQNFCGCKFSIWEK